MSANKGQIISYSKYIHSLRKTLLTPAIWRWNDIIEQLRVSEGQGSRTVMALCHPELRETAAAAPDIAVVVQKLRPGQKSKLHRHSPWAIHFVLNGEGCTIIDGIEYKWTFGDAVLTPAWTYHQHINTSATEEAILYTLQNIPELCRKSNIFREEPAGSSPKHIIESGEQLFKPPIHVTSEEEYEDNW
ncbi:5-nitrosalicylic acid 1,2-dioxygenase [compost metagenome]